MTSQKKDLTRGGADVFQISFAPSGLEEPMNIAPYAEDAKYRLSAISRQVKVSGLSGDSCTCSTMFHKLMNSVRSLMVLGPAI
jgi:hypothetical protein